MMDEYGQTTKVVQYTVVACGRMGAPMQSFRSVPSVAPMCTLHDRCENRVVAMRRESGSKEKSGRVATQEWG